MPDTMPARAWAPDSWRTCPIKQVPTYPNGEKLASMEALPSHRGHLLNWYDTQRLTPPIPCGASAGQVLALVGAGREGTPSFARGQVSGRVWAMQRRIVNVERSLRVERRGRASK